MALPAEHGYRKDGCAVTLLPSEVSFVASATGTLGKRRAKYHLPLCHDSFRLAVLPCTLDRVCWRPKPGYGQREGVSRRRRPLERELVSIGRPRHNEQDAHRTSPPRAWEDEVCEGSYGEVVDENLTLFLTRKAWETLREEGSAREGGGGRAALPCILQSALTDE